MKKIINIKHYQKHRRQYIFRRFNFAGKILCTLGLVKIYVEAHYEEKELYIKETIRFFGYDATVKRTITEEMFESSNFTIVDNLLLFDTEGMK